MADGYDPTPYSNPPRTEEISVAHGSGIGGGAVAGVCLGVLAVGLSAGLPAFVVVLAVLGLLFGAGFSARSAQENLRWDPLMIHFGQTQLPLGSTSTVTIERRSRKPIPDVVNHNLDVTLKCVEWVRYTVGTDTRTDTATVVERVFPVVGSILASTFVGEFELEIPVDRGGPSLLLHNNKISWTLEIELSPISTVGGQQDVELNIPAELDRRHMRFVDAPPPPRPQDA